MGIPAEHEGFYDEILPNVFYEPRTAVSPFYVLYEGSAEYIAAGPFDNRADAEENARTFANNAGGVYLVVGTVSISSCPPPVKASTRALV